MKNRILALVVLIAATLSFSQTGLMGGSDGIHQQNAKTLEQWRFVAGTGGNVSLEPWALARGGFSMMMGKNTNFKILIFLQQVTSFLMLNLPIMLTQVLPST